MSILDNVVAALKGAPTSIREVDKQLAKLKAEREVVRKAPPHIDDLHEWFKRGLDAASADALGRLHRWHLNPATVASWSGDTYDNAPGPQILGLTQLAPNHTTPAPASSTPDLAMLTHFLRPVIEPQLRKLVDDAVGDAFKDGVRASERQAKVAKLDEKIAKLEGERAELVEGVRQAQLHLSGNVVPERGVSDADVAREVAEYERATGARVGV